MLVTEVSMSVCMLISQLLMGYFLFSIPPRSACGSWRAQQARAAGPQAVQELLPRETGTRGCGITGKGIWSKAGTQQLEQWPELPWAVLGRRAAGTWAVSSSQVGQSSPASQRSILSPFRLCCCHWLCAVRAQAGTRAV